MTSDRVAEAERAFMEAAERMLQAEELHDRQRFVSDDAALLATYRRSSRARGDTWAAYRALQAARAGKEAGRGE